jgi:hypothetical protein
MDITIVLWICSLVLTLLGLAGLLLPALPGAPLLFVGLLLAAWAENFAFVGWKTLVILGIMALLTYVVEFAASAFGVKRFGASNRAMVGAMVGGVAGLFFGLPGVLLGPFVGAVIGELSLRRSLPEAGRAGIGASVGMALGVAAKLALGFGMVGIYLLARFF